jgi:hypothetical protein
MHSLWRILALQWLGGEGSDALAADATLDGILTSGERAQVAGGFDVQRQSAAPRQTSVSPSSEDRLKREIINKEQ